MDPAACFNYCPRCGRAIDGAAGARPFRCDGCGFVYFFNAAVSVAVIIVDAADARRALFIRRGHEPGLGKLAFAGGFVDPGERVEAAIAREVREEVGLELHGCDVAGVVPQRLSLPRSRLSGGGPVLRRARAAAGSRPPRSTASPDSCWLDPRRGRSAGHRVSVDARRARAVRVRGQGRGTCWRSAMTQTMFRVLAACALVATALTSSRAAEPATAWPQFRGPDSLGVADGAAHPDAVVEDRERRLVDRGAGPRLVVAGGLERPGVRDLGDQPRRLQGAVDRHLRQRLHRRAAPAGAAARGSEPPRPRARQRSARRSWRRRRVAALLLRRAHRRSAAGTRSFIAAGRSADVIARTPTPPKRRSPTASRVYVYLGNVGLFAWSMDGAPAVAHADRAAAHLSRLRHGLVARPPRRAVSSSSTTPRKQSELLAFDAKTGALRVAARRAITARRWCVPASRRRSSGARRSAPRSSSQGPTTVTSYDVDGRELWRAAQGQSGGRADAGGGRRPAALELRIAEREHPAAGGDSGRARAARCALSAVVRRASPPSRGRRSAADPTSRRRSSTTGASTSCSIRASSA